MKKAEDFCVFYRQCRDLDIAVLRLDRIWAVPRNAAEVKVKVADGTYKNHSDGSAVVVKNGILVCSGNPIVITCDSDIPMQI